MKPFDLHGLKTYELASRPSKVFVEDLGRPVGAGTTVADWLDALPKQLAANDLRKVRDHLCRAKVDGRTVVAAMGGHVIKTGCGPYFVDWIQRRDPCRRHERRRGDSRSRTGARWEDE